MVELASEKGTSLFILGKNMVRALLERTHYFFNA